MSVIALLGGCLLLTGSVGRYRLFSYVAAVFIVAVLGTASLERNDSELDLAPYSRLVLGLGTIFFIGLTGIWSSWHPGTTDYTYLLGLPTSTMTYVVFLWLLPILGAVYYALVFPSIGSDQIVDDIIRDSRRAQRTAQYPLVPSRSEADGEGSSSRTTLESSTAPSGRRARETSREETDRNESETADRKR
ncbi:hypothetical protein [Halocatena salina]|uniref:Uncharacterized protein n=1 Tax=Halocatena salina TaxID=2934340 RepID=A0A8U0A3U4_9EURY|nr:hypothetical protein [Halocatena salina]UPM43118.1 hypothetical protein MW046_01400 [Halocatena salina]